MIKFNPYEQMMFILGRFLNETNRRFKRSPLTVYVSKADFIEIIKRMAVVSKKERAIYKNLELLEKNKLILYKQKKLRLSKKGLNFYNKLFDNYKKQKNIIQKIKTKKISFSRISQTMLKKV